MIKLAKILMPVVLLLVIIFSSVPILNAMHSMYCVDAFPVGECPNGWCLAYKAEDCVLYCEGDDTVLCF